MFQRILVPLDTITRGQPLLEVAGRIARMSQGHILLLTLGDSQPSNVLHSPALVGVQASVQQVDGLLAPAILLAAQRFHADLIVLGSPCHPGNEHWGHQAITEKVALATTVPTLLIRTTGSLAPAYLAGSTPLFRTLVTLDGSHSAEAALGPAGKMTAALAGPDGGEIHLVQVVRRLSTDTAASPRETMLPLDAQARFYLAAQAEALQAQLPNASNLRVTWDVLPALDVAEALANLANGTAPAEAQPMLPFHLLVMGVMGPSGSEPFDLSSVASGVLHATFLPYLVVPNRDTPPTYPIH